MSLKLSLLNIQGLVSRRINVKIIRNRSHFLLQRYCSFDRNLDDDFSDIGVRNFEHFLLNRKDVKEGSRRNSGGIVIYIRNKFVSKDTLKFTSEDDFLWVKFVLIERSIHLFML